MAESLSAVHRYHDGTKHHFHRFARALGYLDWASQPRPFRQFAGAPRFPLYPRPDAGGRVREIGDVLRHALGLSAWKSFRDSRWPLRANPSSGNLHPTEAYVICRAAEGLAAAAGVYHYLAEEHALELRCEFTEDPWRSSPDRADHPFLVILTSIHWREAWKYGERAFRYCQHDLGHAIAAVSMAAAAAGLRSALLPSWSHADIAAAAGLDRAGDFLDAEPEEPGCVIVVSRTRTSSAGVAPAALLEAVSTGRWHGRASQLSDDHVQWTFIDEIASATRTTEPAALDAHLAAATAGATASVRGDESARPRGVCGRSDFRQLALRRRSAVAFDGVTASTRSSFLELMAAVLPDGAAPWGALWWTPRIHLALFVHRVSGLDPGLYMLVRDAAALAPLKAAAQRDFSWQTVDPQLPLFLLAAGDCRRLAQRLSCDQEIAADGFFSLGMIAQFDESLDRFGPSFYRHLFWESGFVGQLLYLQAEAIGARATGIGCFYDDPVHDVLGLRGHAFQSLYHFTVGCPVDDARLTTEPGYSWEGAPA